MRIQSIGMVGLVALVACEAPPRMQAEASTVPTGTDVVVTFDEALSGRATNQYWIALQPVDAPASATTGRLILERTDRVVRLRASTPGDFEVRLHGQYPKEEHHLLARIPIKVEGWPVKTGIEQMVDREADTEECLDRWLAARKLDPYGGPQGTTYAGGSPLFDETTGTSTSRWDYVVAIHPEAERTCPRGR